MFLHSDEKNTIYLFGGGDLMKFIGDKADKYDSFVQICNKKILNSTIHLTKDDYPLLEKIKSGDSEAEKILEKKCSVVQLTLKKILDNAELVIPNVYLSSLEDNYYIIFYETGDICKYGRKNYKIHVKDNKIWYRKKGDESWYSIVDDNGKLDLNAVKFSSLFTTAGGKDYKAFYVCFKGDGFFNYSIKIRNHWIIAGLKYGYKALFATGVKDRKYDTDHLDGNVWNNCPENLGLVSHAENIRRSKERKKELQCIA